MLLYIELYYNLIFAMFYIKMSFITIFLVNFESFISWYFMSQFSKQFPLNKIREHQIVYQYQVSDDSGELDLKSDVNQT